MGKTTAIEWTEATWNPWHGCIKVSTGCKNCYMYRQKLRFGQNPKVVRRSKTTFFNPLKWAEPRMIFTCSWSDWFIKNADEWRNEAWDIIQRTPQHTYQILTKRPERIRSYLPTDWGEGWQNVWLGVSIESQKYVGRADILREIPVCIRFISAEPLLGPLDLCDLSGIDWVITGGESGPRARPMKAKWARLVKDQCTNQGVAFFHKQNGGAKKISGAWGGRLLDDRTWEEMPTAAFCLNPPL